MGNHLSLEDCLPWTHHRDEPLVVMNSYGDTVPKGIHSAVRKTPQRASLKRDMNASIQHLHRIIESRNRDITACERQVLRYKKSPGKENARWAMHHFRRLKRMNRKITQHYHMLEMMQTIKNEMHMAEDMADAYDMFSRYSKEFSTVVTQLREYDAEGLMETFRENLQTLDAANSALEEGTSAEVLLTGTELAEYKREVATLERKYAETSLDEYLYNSTDADESAADGGHESTAEEGSGGILDNLVSIFSSPPASDRASEDSTRPLIPS